MEFDNNIKFKDIRTVFVKSGSDIGTFLPKVWEIAAAKSRHVGQAGETEIWMDYSDLLRSRHLSCTIAPAEGGYELRFRGGSRPGLFGDVLIMALVLFAFWMLSKLLVPSPPVVCIVLMILALAAAAATALYCGKTFGKEESEVIIKEISQDL